MIKSLLICAVVSASAVACSTARPGPAGHPDGCGSHRPTLSSGHCLTDPAAARGMLVFSGAHLFR